MHLQHGNLILLPPTAIFASPTSIPRCLGQDYLPLQTFLCSLYILNLQRPCLSSFRFCIWCYWPAGEAITALSLLSLYVLSRLPSYSRWPHLRIFMNHPSSHSVPAGSISNLLLSSVIASTLSGLLLWSSLQSNKGGLHRVREKQTCGIHVFPHSVISHLCHHCDQSTLQKQVKGGKFIWVQFLRGFCLS